MSHLFQFLLGLLALFSFLFPLAAEEETEEQNLEAIYKGVFGKSPNTKLRKEKIVILINNHNSFEALASLKGNFKVLSIHKKTVLDALKKILRHNHFQQILPILKKESEGEMLSISNLHNAGINTKYNSFEQKLHLTLGYEKLRPLEQSLLKKKGYLPIFGEPLESNAFSSYLNYRISDTFRHRSTSDTIKTRLPLQIDFESATRSENWLLDAKFDFNENRTAKWSPSILRAVYDEPEQAIRYVIGDHKSDQIGFMSPFLVGGAGVEKNYTLDPNRVTFPQGKRILTLEKDSEVEVWVNNEKITVLNLPKGEHILTDFPFITGTNHYQLRITDSFGRKIILDDEYILEGKLLATEVSQFAFVGGLKVQDSDGKRSYRDEDPSFQAFYRRGRTDSHTVGVHMQVGVDQELIGTDHVFASKYGLFEWDLGLSHRSSEYYGLATQLHWNSLGNHSSEQKPYYNAQIEIRDKRFNEIGASPSDTPVFYSINAAISYQLPKNIYSTLSGGFTKKHNIRANGYSIGINLTKSFTPWYASINTTYDHPIDGRPELATLFQLDYRSNSGKHLTSYSHNTQSHTNALRYNYEPGTVEGNRFSTNIDNDTDQTNVNIRYSHLNSRFRFEYSNQYTNTHSGTADKSTIGYSSSLVYVDKHLTWSSPIRDSFLLLSPHPNLNDVIIGVNPDGNHETFQKEIIEGKMLILNRVNSYYANRVEISAVNLPLGKDLGTTLFSYTPKYKGGALLRIGSAAQVILKVKLKDPDGNHVRYQPGTLELMDSKEKRTYIFFTNSKGTLQTKPLIPGTYLLQLDDPKFNPIKVVVPEDKQGLYRLNFQFEE